MPNERKLRKPGALPQISDEVLRDTMDPEVIARMTPSQRTRRRTLRKVLTRARRAERVAQAVKEGKPRPVSKCVEIKANGERCGNYAIGGVGYCHAHCSDEVRATFSPPVMPHRHGKKAPEVMREVVEVAVESILRPYFDALGVTFEGYDEDNNPVVTYNPRGGIMMHGESKDGEIIMTDYENLTARVQVAERLLDRVYGKARQTTVMEGGVTPIKVQPVRSEDRARQVADLLMRSGALPPAQAPHDGRRRSKPSTKADVPAEPVENGEGAHDELV